MDERLLTEAIKLRKLINYRIGSEPEIIEEGYKDWLIGATLLATAIMSPSKANSQINKLTPEKAETTIQTIKNIIQDTSKLKQVANYLNTNGYPGSSRSIKLKVIGKGNEMIKQLKQVKNRSDATLDIVTTTDPKEATKLFRKGYVFTKAEIKEILNTVYADVDEVPAAVDSISGNADNFFPFGDITLNDDIKQKIHNTIDSFGYEGYKITNIRIVSGTDFVRVIPGGTLDSMGIHDNNQLATARANAIKDYIGSIILDTSVISTCTFPNNIENKPGYQQNEKLRIAGVDFVAIKTSANLVIPAITKTTTGEFELIKPDIKHSTIKPPKPRTGKTISKKILINDIPCPKFD
jgi:outer membrane protein OmpA-like peptidoglycan-associated protein